MALGATLSAVTASDATFSAAGATAWLTVKDRTVTLSGVASEAQGGTGASSIAAAGILVSGGALGTPASGVATNLTGTAAGLTAGTASAVAVGGITGLGTNVATALAVNVGTAGAPVVNGGALGTPSAGVGTNITGVNAATLGGATFAAPAAIGSGTPAAGSFTTLTSTGLVSMAKRASAYQWTDYTMTDAAGATTTAPATAAATSAATTYITAANSSGTVTFTLVAGTYEVKITQHFVSSQTNTLSQSIINLGGTATRLVAPASPTMSMGALVQWTHTVTFLVTATAAQTLTVQPQGRVTGSGTGANTTCSVNAVVTYMGNS